LKAALNEAYQEGRIPINEAWQRVRAFRKVDTADISRMTKRDGWLRPAGPISARLSLAA
jgi:hypothetical protein